MEPTNSKFPLNTHPGNQPDIYVKCPYFPEHELRQSRMPYHIIKCQKNPNAPKLVACPYNYLHRIKPEDRADHIILCKDRIPVKYADREAPSYANTRRKEFGIRDNGRQVVRNNSTNTVETTSTADGEEWWD